MTDEQRKAYIAALERERRSQTADHAAIDAELERLNPQPARKRAEMRPRAKAQTR
jgi:hypothetical protein